MGRSISSVDFGHGGSGDPRWFEDLFGSRREAIAGHLLYMEDESRNGRTQPRRSSSHAKAWPAHGRTLGADLGLRGTGLTFILLSIAAIHWLSMMIHGGARHDATPLEFLLALIGFAGASLGSALLVIGAHVYDPIEISERWRRRF